MTTARADRVTTPSRWIGGRSASASLLTLALVCACGATSAGDAVTAVPSRAVTLSGSRASPWGMVFLPDGRMLVTQKAGTLVILAVDGGAVQAALSGVSPVVADG
jgi:glucose/arabinose dehydrogenase